MSKESWRLISSYLNLQEVIATDALIVHLVVGIVGITTALVLDKGEAALKVSNMYELADGRKLMYLQSAGRSARGRNVAADETSVPS